ncbi:TIGR01459 family HAD-type hydrolase [Pikeienuella piscinae]|uniref:TIGR01459 family HAD-type hydrolase n=1 Tax=Pikeienuella piscinae TaxID=2748098 RepID=A0A7L5BWL6_9RHOB|nr:TIGR01459 family HAD-type hydrolase [Pikeienuella piscinae]QIE55228.1 TIGR01459 family HAD-type hydrolase [Pikeienuella piscinae]
MTEIIASLDSIAARYDAVLCDVWGCYHNGLAPLPGAVAALRAFRARGGAVVLLTNAPRPEEAVKRQLAAMSAPEDSWDAIASSGGAARDALWRGEWGAKVHHIGSGERDEAFFEGDPVARVRLEDAESLVVTGLRDDRTETPADYDDLLTEAKLRGLPMLCANPDLVVDVGGERRHCAGALAALYREKGGVVTEYGKPHPQIYDYARNILTSTIGRAAPDERILCIGDGVATDVAGAMGEGLDCLFVAGGLAAAEALGPDGAPDAEKLDAFLAKSGVSARYAMGLLK